MGAGGESVPGRGGGKATHDRPSRSGVTAMAVAAEVAVVVRPWPAFMTSWWQMRRGGGLAEGNAANPPRHDSAHTSSALAPRDPVPHGPAGAFGLTQNVNDYAGPGQVTIGDVSAVSAPSAGAS